MICSLTVQSSHLGSIDGASRTLSRWLLILKCVEKILNIAVKQGFFFL